MTIGYIWNTPKKKTDDGDEYCLIKWVEEPIYDPTNGGEHAVFNKIKGRKNKFVPVLGKPKRDRGITMNNIFKTIKPFMTKHQPEILMSMGIGGMIFSTIWGIKATNRAKDIITNAQDKEYNKAYHVVSTDPYILTNKDKIKLTWKLYIPVVVSMAVSIPCIVAGNRVSNKRNAALAAAYTLSETVLQEYQEKTREIVGEKEIQSDS